MYKQRFAKCGRKRGRAIVCWGIQLGRQGLVRLSGGHCDETIPESRCCYTGVVDQFQGMEWKSLRTHNCVDDISGQTAYGMLPKTCSLDLTSQHVGIIEPYSPLPHSPSPSGYQRRLRRARVQMALLVFSVSFPLKLDKTRDPYSYFLQTCLLPKRSWAFARYSDLHSLPFYWQGNK